jgi:hypothetical protein
VVDAVLSDGVAAVEADAAVVALIEPGEARLRLLGMRGYPPELAARMEEITLDAPVPLADALRTGRPVWIDGAGEAPPRSWSATRAMRPASAWNRRTPRAQPTSTNPRVAAFQHVRL